MMVKSLALSGKSFRGSFIVCGWGGEGTAYADATTRYT